MNKFKEKLKKLGRKIQYWLYGCYGYDEFAKFLSILILICIALSIFTLKNIFNYIAAALYFYMFFRFFSKNRYKRGRENSKYLSVLGKIKSRFRLIKRKFSDRKHFRYYRCKKCKTVMRVPKGKGKIEITCPGCGTKTIKKT